MINNTQFTLPQITLSAIEKTPNNAGTTVIALHGWLDNANSFIPMMALNDSIKVIAIDLAGHGLSGHRGADCTYQLLDYVYDLYVLIESNNWGKIHLLGHSMGAIVASIFAGTFPELVDKLVLIEALGTISAQPNETRAHLKQSILERYQVQKKSATNRRYHSLEQVISVRAQASNFNTSIAKLLVERSIERDSDGYKWRSDPRLRLKSAIKMTEEQALDILSGITQDTLLILATHGYTTIRKQLKQRVSTVKDLKINEVVGGHHVHMEQPAAVWLLIEQHFIESKLDN